MKSLASEVSKIAKPVVGKRGFAGGEIITQWAAVVGEDLAQRTLPVKLAFSKGERTGGTLHLRVAPGSAPEVQHLEPLIVERINGFFGYKAVGRLALKQGPLPGSTPPGPTPPRPLDSTEDANLVRSLDGITDPDLRAALERFGRAVIGSQPAEAPRLHLRKKPVSF